MTTASTAFDPSRLPSGIEIKGAVRPGYERVLTPEALAFVADLARRFEPTRPARENTPIGATSRPGR